MKNKLLLIMILFMIVMVKPVFVNAKLISDSVTYKKYNVAIKSDVLFLTNPINYEKPCENEDVLKEMKLIGYILYLMKFIAPVIIIVLGMLDYVKAVASDDDKLLITATKSLIRRIGAGIAIIFIPSVILIIPDVTHITNGIHDINNTKYGACTMCLLDPINNCN